MQEVEDVGGLKELEKEVSRKFSDINKKNARSRGNGKTCGKVAKSKFRQRGHK